MKFAELGELVLQETGKQMTSSEIWKKAEETGLTVLLNSKGKTPESTLGARLGECASKGKVFGRVKNEKVWEYYLLDDQKLEPEENTEVEIVKTSWIERDLHPLLVRFANNSEHFKAYVKTIYHETSVKGHKGENEWVHPDLVGFYFPYESYSPLTRELAAHFNQNQFRLFSFEMKRSVNSSNLREYFFQAVSNSSWANEGYLVALHFSEEEKFRNELSRLSNSFGIGIIELDPNNVDQSKILFPAASREVDWDTVDKLVNLNRTFRELVESIEGDIKSGKVHDSEYDKILSKDEIEEWVKDRHIQ